MIPNSSAIALGATIILRFQSFRFGALLLWLVSKRRTAKQSRRHLQTLD
ncbi:hypothetical protein ACF3DV_26480 [Chlorogloeopsis fritschii PCC 9212]|nr:hypothetical protein [Chlorogloeopsis fritschii]